MSEIKNIVGRLPSMMTTLYIAGPMTGLPEYNYPAFREAERQLRAAGFDVLNPANHKPTVANPAWSDYMRLGIAAVCLADGVALLPGSEESRGARAEMRVAEDIDIPVHSLTTWLKLGSEV